MKKNILIFILILFISVGFIFILNKSQDDPNLSKEAFAAIKINGKYGLIDTKGNIVIAPIYDDTLIFREGLAKVGINGKYGFIDKKGNIVIAPIYDFAGNFLIEINTK